MVSSTLVVTGVGIKSISHLTTENIAAIEQADVVFYLVNEPILIDWIKKKSKKSEALDPIYFSHQARKQSYANLADYIIQMTSRYQNICLAVYGHPTLLSDTVTHLIKNVDRNNVLLSIMPGISSYDCLLADLEIDVYDGCLNIDANALLTKNKKVDITNHLIVWQVGLIDDRNTVSEDPDKQAKLDKLKNYLLQHYSNNHPCILYEASLYPHLAPKITKFLLSDLEKKSISRITTLYLPPIQEVSP